MIKENNLLKRGFSLIEIVIAIAIMAVLAMVVMPNAFKYLSRSKMRAEEANVKALDQAVKAYYLHVGQYPASLEDLIHKPENMSKSKWGGKYIDQEELPKDRDGNDFVYERNPNDVDHPYKIYSLSDEKEE